MAQLSTLGIITRYAIIRQRAAVDSDGALQSEMEDDVADLVDFRRQRSRLAGQGDYTISRCGI